MRTAVRRALVILVVTGAVIALPAQAGHRDWDRHNDYSRHDRGGYENYGGYNNYGDNYGHNYSHDYRHDSYRGGHHRSRGRHHGREALFLAGGLIVGSVLTNAYHNSYERRVVRQPVYREVVYDSSPIVRSTQVIRQNEGRRLFRDRNGDCFERTTSANGEELLVELDRSTCAW